MITLALTSLFGLILPALVSGQCSSDFSTFTASDGFTYGYKVILQDMLNYFEAADLCYAQGAQVASIHSADENNFIFSLSANLLNQCQNNNSVCAQRVSRSTASGLSLDQLLRSFWLGMHRLQFVPYYNATVDCIWSDGTICDYGRFDGVATATQNVTPWSTGNPSGSNNSAASPGSGYTEDCVEISTGGLWNDISCYHKLGGVICKKNCTNPCPSAAAPTTTTSASKLTTTLSTATNTTASSGGGYVCGSDGWQWTHYKGAGQAYAYKLFKTNGSYWQLNDICYEYCASPCSVETQEENQYIQSIISNSSASNGRRKRSTSTDSCTYTGMHRYQINPPNGSIGCSCDDGSSCSYGNGDTTTTTSSTSTTKAATTTTKLASTSTTKLATTTKPSTTIKTTTFVSTSTSGPINPWAPGCPATISTGLGDTNGYGNKNCIGYDANGKWMDRACERPGTGVICKKSCIPPA